MKQAIAISILALAICCVGCTDPYGGAAKAGADVAASINQGMQSTYQISQNGQISKSEESNLLDYFEFANTADKAFLTCISTAHQNGNKPGTYTACAQSFNGMINDPQKLALIKVSNPTVEKNVTVIVNGLTVGVNAILTGLKGA